MERMGLLLDSLRKGIVKYQSGDLANMVSQSFATWDGDRNRLWQHIRDLARMREQEYQIANEEAQRCRGLLTRQVEPDKKSGRIRNRQAEQN